MGPFRGDVQRTPDYSIFAGPDAHGGYVSNETSSLTAPQLKDPHNGEGTFKDIEPGDTVEVHWVYSSCKTKPGHGLSSCLQEGCAHILRVEAQVFLLVNDPYALNFNDYTLETKKTKGKYQAKTLPTSTGTPIVYRGSTTGTSYTATELSPTEVTWSVRPQTAKLDIESLHEWAKGNVFEEHHAHGVRRLVQNPELLSPIK